MGRLVRKPTLPAAEMAQASTGDFGGMFQAPARTRRHRAEPGDDYLMRMVKYVPAEIIGILDGGQCHSRSSHDRGSANADHGRGLGDDDRDLRADRGLILTPLFCWYVREDGDAWVTNAVVSTVAFPFWAYLMGAVAFAKIHDGNLAVDPDLAFTAVSGLVAPVVEAIRQVAGARQSAKP